MALAGRRRTVVEDMAEMSAATAAMLFGAGHSEGQVAPVGDGVGQRFLEARPAGAAVIFGRRAEQRQFAAGAGENPLAMFLEQRAGEGRLGAGFAKDVEALRAEAPAPFVGGPLNLETCRLPASGQRLKWQRWCPSREDRETGGGLGHCSCGRPYNTAR